MIRENRRKSKIWFLPEQEFKQLVNNCKTYTEILKYFDLSNKGNNYKTLKTRIKELDISVDHFEAQNHASIIRNTIPLEKVLIENSLYTSNYNLKKKLFKHNLVKNECYECGLKDSWNGKKLSLTLDHKNGKSNDNRIDNLRILCPNCHSQTDTFAGKNKKY